MAHIPFDTLKFVHRLRKANVPEDQAEAFAEAIRDSHVESDLATKSDLRELQQANKADLRELETNLDMKMQALEYRMTLKLGGITVASVGLLGAMIKLL